MRHILLIAMLMLPVFVGCGTPAEHASEPVTVYCFHGYAKCEYCEKIEQWSHEALRENFADQLADGRIVWKVVNFQAPGNEHFAQDYEIITSCIVLDPTPSQPGDDWTNLQQQVWQHATADDRQGLERLVTNRCKRISGARSSCWP